jgi:hypothetical protein
MRGGVVGGADEHRPGALRKLGGLLHWEPREPSA